MAVWQYQLNIIPRSVIIEKYGEIPNKLFIDEKGWKDYWDNTKFDSGFPDPEFEDALTINWWKNKTLNIQETANQIDKLVKRGDWSNDKDFIGWKGDSEEEEDNDCHIAFNENTFVISEFQFRTDLRNIEKAKKFMAGMLKICIVNDLLVMNTDGFLYDPEMEIIFEDIKKSNSVKFLTNPMKFIEEITEDEDKRFRIEPKKQNIWNKIKSIFNK